MRPDVMTVAKGLGGGLPIGAVRDRARTTPTCSSPATTARPSRAARWSRAAANAVLDVVDDEAFLADGAREGRAAGGRAARPGPRRARRRADAGLRARRTRPTRPARAARGAPGAERHRPGHGAAAAAAHGVRRRDRRGGRAASAPRWRDPPASPTAATWPPREMERSCPAAPVPRARRASTATGSSSGAARGAGAAARPTSWPRPASRCGARSTSCRTASSSALDAQGGRGLRLPAPSRCEVELDGEHQRRRRPTRCIDKEPEQVPPATAEYACWCCVARERGPPSGGARAPSV